MDTVRVGLIGSGFVSAIHHEALRRVPGAEVIAVASPTAGHAARFGGERGFAHAFDDVRALLDLKAVDLVVLGLPNDLHCETTVLAAVSARIQRQEIVADRSKSFRIVLTESVLRYQVCPPAEMLAVAGLTSTVAALPSRTAISTLFPSRCVTEIINEARGGFPR